MKKIVFILAMLLIHLLLDHLSRGIYLLEISNDTKWRELLKVVKI